MGAFWDLIDSHLSRMEFPPSKRRLAARLGVSPQTVTNWQSMIELPKRENIEAVADFVGKPYKTVLEAALIDTGYAVSARSAAPAEAMPATEQPTVDDATLDDEAAARAERDLDEATPSGSEPGKETG